MKIYVSYILSQEATNQKSKYEKKRQRVNGMIYSKYWKKNTRPGIPYLVKLSLRNEGGLDFPEQTKAVGVYHH